MEVERSKVSLDDLEAEQREIEDQFLKLRFAQKVRRTTIACYKRCGGKLGFPFIVVPDSLIGMNEVCFGDCLNINFEKGPFLNELGAVPEDAIPKKFIWPHDLWVKTRKQMIFKFD